MAVSGVQTTEPTPREWFDGLMFWGVMYRRVAMFELLRGSWLFALGTGLVGSLVLPLAANFKGGAGVHALLGWLTLMHLLSRGWVERRLPDPSFANDVRTGNFEQLRLTPHTAHTLLIQRGLPDLMFRLLTMSLWLPLYALTARVLGLTFLDALALWTLFSIANYFVLMLVALTLAASAWEGVFWLVGVGFWGYAFLLDGGRTRTAVANSGLFSVMIALPILGRVLLPQQMMVALPDLRGMALLWLVVETLRFERTARWVNAPSGVWRGFFIAPCLAVLGVWGMFALQQGEAQGYSGGAQTHYAAVGVMAAAGYLNIVLLTLRRQADVASQPLCAHLWESGLLRLMGLLAIGVGLVGIGLPTGSGAFWGVLAGVAIVEWLGGALTRQWLQRAHAHAPAWAYGALALGVAPALVFYLAPRWTLLGALSPTYALMMASDIWSVTGALTQPPLWLCVAMPAVRYLLVLGVLAWGVRAGRRMQLSRALPALRWLALPLLYPLLDLAVQRRTENPVAQLTVAERQPPFAPLLGCASLVVSAADALGRNWSVLLIIPLGVFLWIWGYYSAARRVRRWLDSGELNSAFLAGLTPAQLFWGWVYGAWYQQGRVVVAVCAGALLGWLGHSLLFPTPFGVGLAGIFLVIGFSYGVLLVYLLLWSCAWLVAAPAAIRDQLTASSSAAPLVTPRTALQAALFSTLGCCAPLAPFLLVGLPFYISQSVIALHQRARPVGELKR